MQVLEKGPRLRPAFGHPARQHKVGKMRLPEQCGLLLPQRQDLLHQFLIGLWRPAADIRRGLPDLPAQRLVPGVKHHRLLRWLMQRDAPGRLHLGAVALLQRALARRLPRVLGQTPQPVRIREDKLPGVRGIEHILRIFLGERSQFALERLQALFLCRG